MKPTILALYFDKIALLLNSSPAQMSHKATGVQRRIKHKHMQHTEVKKLSLTTLTRAARLHGHFAKFLIGLGLVQILIGFVEAPSNPRVQTQPAAILRRVQKTEARLEKSTDLR